MCKDCGTAKDTLTIDVAVLNGKKYLVENVFFYFSGGFRDLKPYLYFGYFTDNIDVILNGEDIPLPAFKECFFESVNSPNEGYFIGKKYTLL